MDYDISQYNSSKNVKNLINCTCHYCNKKFKSLQSKHVHIKKCKIKYEEKQLIENKKK